MKKFGRPVGIILATAYLGMVLGLEYIRILDWKSLLILFAMFLVWASIVFANLATFFDNRDIKFLGFEISAKKSSNIQVRRPQHNEEKLKEQRKIDFHKEFERVNFPGLDIMIEGEYRTPTGVSNLASLVNQAKKADYNLTEDNAYLDAASAAQKGIVNQLCLSVYDYDNENYVFSHHIEEQMDEALYESSYNKDTFTRIRLVLIEQLGHKEAINHRFERAINDLDKISADSDLA